MTSSIRRYRDLGVEATLDLPTGITDVHIFGRAPDGVQITPTDLWDRADAVPTQQVWLAPTAARIHAIVSTSASDTDGGAGARTVRVRGLTSWTTAEVEEFVTLDGVTPVNTANEYVMINSLIVATSGASGPNVGAITATAATDSTVTQAILAGNGNAKAAVYGWPSGYSLVLNKAYGGMLQGGAGNTADLSLLFNRQPDTQPTVFSHLGEHAITGAGASTIHHTFDPPASFAGPGLMKIHATASIADIDMMGGFDGLLVKTA